jgi:signal peptidase I
MPDDQMTDVAPQGPTEPAGESKPPSSLSNALSWVRDLIFSVLIAVVLIVFIYQPVKVEGTSMEPGLDDQERIFINKFTYEFGLSSIERGDTVVFRWPVDTQKSYIKRVIGLPGDRVRIDHGTVYVNGKPLKEDYVEEMYRDRTSMAGITVPPNQYFVLGDHRSSSSDSRSWGFVPRENIYGKAVFAYWPLDKMGRLH